MRRLFLPFILTVFVSLFAAAGVGAAGPPAYVALGDSLATGVGASDRATLGYVGQVHRGLLESSPYQERGLELLNLGASGATSTDLLKPGGQVEQALAEIQRRAQDADTGNEVEIITVDIGGDDLLALLKPGSPCFSNPLGSACVGQAFPEALSRFEANLRQALRALRQATPEAHLVVITLYNSFAGQGSPLKEAGDIAVSQFNPLVAQVAAEADIQARVADVRPLFQERPASEVIAPDLIHPTDAGHALIATAVLAALKESGALQPQEAPEEPAAALPALGAADETG
ncbi:MAG TPA: GDSL-type esterase/lipase family protein, partial [Dehalococcoidia bacterium]|nr:GDSL-type esterase/lipase family protein [Dehalococcoidia bacterium]